VDASKSVVAHGSHKDLGSDKEKQIRLRSGRESDKDQLMGILKTCYKKANSKDSIFELLTYCGVKNYVRGGKISGVNFEDKKFRLKGVGFLGLPLKSNNNWLTNIRLLTS